MMLQSINKAFTLFEIIVTVAIVGVLASISVPTYTDYIRRAELSEIKSMAEQVVRRVVTCASTNFTDGASCNETLNRLDGGLTFASNYYWFGGRDIDKARMYLFSEGGRRGVTPVSDTLIFLLYINPSASTAGGYYCYYYIDWKSGKVTNVYNYAFDGSTNDYNGLTCDAK